MATSPPTAAARAMTRRQARRLNAPPPGSPLSRLPTTAPSTTEVAVIQTAQVSPALSTPSADSVVAKVMTPTPYPMPSWAAAVPAAATVAPRNDRVHLRRAMARSVLLRPLFKRAEAVRGSHRPRSCDRGRHWVRDVRGVRTGRAARLEPVGGGAHRHAGA